MQIQVFFKYLFLFLSPIGLTLMGILGYFFGDWAFWLSSVVFALGFGSALGILKYHKSIGNDTKTTEPLSPAKKKR